MFAGVCRHHPINCDIGCSVGFGCDVRTARHQQPLHGGVRPQLRGVLKGMLPCFAGRQLLGLPDARDRPLFQLVGRKVNHRLLSAHRTNLSSAGPSFGGSSAIRKHHTENVGRLSQHTRRFQGFDAFRSRRHVARGRKRFISRGFEIMRSLRGLLHDHPVRSVRQARWKAIRLLPTSSDRSGLALHGCGRTWCISASSARIRFVRLSLVERSRRPGIADSGVAPPCVVSA